MNSDRGVFIMPEENLRESPERQGQIEAMPQLGIGEIVEIKGVKFKVLDIKTRGRLMLKMVATNGN